MFTQQVRRSMAVAVAVTVAVPLLVGNLAAASASTSSCSPLTQPIQQSVNPKTGASLLTSSSAEVTSAAINHGFTDKRGAIFKASSKNAPGLVPVYRLFKKNDFIFVPDTKGVGEYENVISKYGYASQKVEFYASATSISCGIEVRRFLKGSQHRFSASANDQAKLKASGWKDEGAKFWVQTSNPPGPLAAPTSKPLPVTPSPTPSSKPTLTTAPQPISKPAPGVPTTPPPAPITDPASWIRYEKIAQPGETIAQVLLNPALAGKYLKLPVGVFEVSDYRNASAAIIVPRNVLGILGEGSNTIIRMKPMTSTFAASVPPQSAAPSTNQLYLLRMNDGLEKQLIKDVWFQGTAQGHMQNGVMIGNSKSGTTIENVLFTGFDGNAGSPPGETFALNWWRGSGGQTRSIEVDGYRWSGDTYETRVRGDLVGASPIGWNSHDGARVYDTYTHDSAFGMPTFWQSNSAETWNLQSVRNVIGINHEESFGITHHQPVMVESRTRRHINHMSSRSDGALTVIGAINDAWVNSTTSGPVSQGAKMLVLTPTNYTGMNTNRIVTPPVILLKDGMTKAPYTWAH